MGKSHSADGGGGGGGTNLASCIVAAVFLILILVSAFAVYFAVFKPKDPKISVNAVQVPAFSAANSTANFTFSQYVTVRNPNRAVFAHYDSSLQLLRGGTQVGLMFIPAGKIGPGRNNYIAATFTVRGFPVTVSGQPGTVGENGLRSGASFEVESRLEMAGRVRVLHILNHHVEAKVECRVAIGVSDGSVLGLHC